MELSGALLKQDGTLKRDFYRKYKKMYCLYHWLANRISCINYIKELGAEKQHFCVKWCLWGVFISRFSRKQKVLNFTGDKDEREKLKDSIRKLVKLQVDQLIWLIFFQRKLYIYNYIIIYLDYKFIKCI